MKSAAVLAVLALSAAALPPRLHAAEAFLEFDSKFPPPAFCLQQTLGFRDQVGRMSGGAGAAAVSNDAATTGWAERGRSLKATVSASDWRRLENAWDRYASAPAGAARAIARACTGEQLATAFGTDTGYVVLAPLEILGAFFPDEKGEASPSAALLPVGGAIGLATDSIYLAAWPAVTLTAKVRAYRAARAFKRYTDLVVELEGSKGG
ncbi:MAG: hypothetical protein ACHQ51_07515 [Elusimicrobiota bacterium]